jgi:hypothetical protein
LKEPTPKYKTLKGEVMEAWISEILPESPLHLEIEIYDPEGNTVVTHQAKLDEPIDFDPENLKGLQLILLTDDKTYGDVPNISGVYVKETPLFEKSYRINYLSLSEDKYMKFQIALTSIRRLKEVLDI